MLNVLIEELKEQYSPYVEKTITLLCTLANEHPNEDIAISMIESLFKDHKTMTIGLANFLISNILPQVFRERQSESMLKFGILLINNMTEYLGYELL